MSESHRIGWCLEKPSSSFYDLPAWTARHFHHPLWVGAVTKAWPGFRGEDTRSTSWRTMFSGLSRGTRRYSREIVTWRLARC